MNAATFLNSATDYEGAGMLADVFADPDTVEALIRKMEANGYLDGREIAHTFDLLRANDLVFRYMVDNWLLGKPPPAFDLLAWNADSTNLPGLAHGHFLRQMYVENALARDEFVALGERLVTSEISTDSYIVAAVDDHIVPWRVSYRTTQLFKGPVRFVLGSSGHIAGIVSPPNPKVRLWTNDELPKDPDTWLAGAVEAARDVVERLGSVDRGPGRRAGRRHRRWGASVGRCSATRRARTSGAEAGRGQGPGVPGVPGAAPAGAAVPLAWR